MNNVILNGRLVNDIELRFTKEGLALGKGSIAVDKGLSKEKKQEFEALGKPTADFINFSFFGGQAEFLANYTEKGARILLRGRIQTSTYKDQQTGKNNYYTEVVGQEVEIFDWKDRKETYRK